MDSILVVYYSYTGVSRRVAQLLASHHGWSLAQVRETRPRAGFLGGVRCVLDSLLRREPEIEYDGPPLTNYRTVVLVAPIWMYQLAGPMRRFVHHNAAKLPRVAQVVLMNAAGASNAIAEVARLLGHPPLRTAEFLSREIEDGSATGRLLEFGHALVNTAPEHAAHPHAPVPAEARPLH